MSTVMKNTLWKLIAVAFIALALLFIFSGCAPRDIRFESVARRFVVSDNQLATPQVQLIQRPPSRPISGLAADDVATLKSIDYSQYWVLLVIYGFGADEQDNVNSISQQGNVVYVRAEFLPLPDGDQVGSSYEIVRIAKTETVERGTVTLKLMDQFGNEKASLDQTITP